MIRLLYPLKDATIYDKYPELNSGVDQILELTKTTKGSQFEYIDDSNATYSDTYNSRILLKFDITPIQTILSEFPSCQFNCQLNLYCTEAGSIPIDYSIYAYPIAEDWKNGNGNYNDEPFVKNGVSWKYKSGITTADTWSRSYQYNDTYVMGGGSWLTSSAASQSFQYSSPDIKLDITTILKGWLSGSYPNHGIILKFADNTEEDDSVMGSIKYFSKDTHTIYSPKIVLNYNTTSTYSGSFLTSSVADINNVIFHIKNLKSNYNIFDNARFRLKINKSVPEVSYNTNVTNHLGLRLTGSIHFSVLDAIAGVTIIDFDSTGSRIQMDDYGHYFDINFNGFYPERFYKIIYQVVDGNSARQLDFNQVFKISK